MDKTTTGLVAYCKAQVGKPYWYGTYGQNPTLELLEYKAYTQYPYPKYQSYTPARMQKFRAQIGKFDRVHDCVGLIKGYLWSETPDSPPRVMPQQDVSANGMLAACEIKGGMATFPKQPGALVFLSGHVGVYIGNGQVVEARGSDYGVVKTALTSRPWTHWGLCPWIEYHGAPAQDRPAQEPPAKTPTKNLQQGDRVQIKPDAVKYYPGGANIPAWVREESLHVGQIESSGTPVIKGGCRCVLLKEISTWCAIANLEKTEV